MKFLFKTIKNFSLFITITDTSISLNYKSNNKLITSDKDLLNQKFVSKDITDKNRRVVICLMDVLSEIKGEYIDQVVENLIFKTVENLNNVKGKGLPLTL